MSLTSQIIGVASFSGAKNPTKESETIENRYLSGEM